MKIHVPSMLAKGVETNKHNKQATTMVFKIHRTKMCIIGASMSEPHVH